MRPSAWPLVGLVSLLVGCASARAPAGAPPDPEVSARITPAEVRAAPCANALELVHRLRPEWRGWVWVDGVPAGSMAVLEDIPVDRVESVDRGERVDRSGRHRVAILVTSRRR